MGSRSGAARLSANWKAEQLDSRCSCQQQLHVHGTLALVRHTSRCPTDPNH